MSRPSKYKVKCPKCNTLMHVVQTKNYKGSIQKHFKCDKCFAHWRWCDGVWNKLEDYAKPEIKTSNVQLFVDNLIKEQQPKNKLKFKKKIEEDKDMRVKDIALEKNMPVEVAGDGLFMPLWQWDVLDEEAKLEELAKEEAKKQADMDWDRIMANLGPAINKAWED